MAGNVHFELTADEAKAVQGFLKLVDAQKKVSDGAKKAASESRRHAQEHEQGIQGMLIGVGKYIATFASITGIIAGVRKSSALWHEDQEKMLQTTLKVLDAYKDLQYLGENFRNPQLRQQALQEAQRYGIKDVTEVMRGRYKLGSETPTLTEGYREQLWKEMLEMRPTTTLTLPELVTPFAKTAEIAKGQGLSPNEIQNVIKKAQDLASAEPQQFAMTWPRMLSAAEMGKMDIRTAAAMYGVVTAGGATPEQTVTALEAITRGVMLPGEKIKTTGGLLGKGDDKLSRVWRERGIAETGDLFGKMQQLAPAYAAGELGDEELKQLAGEAGVKIFPYLLKNMAEIQRQQGIIRAETGPGQDIIKEKFGTVMRTDPLALGEHMLGREQAKRAGMEVELEPLLDEYVKTLIENRLKEAGASAATRAVAGELYGGLRGLGGGPDYALEKAAAGTFTVDLETWKAIIAEFRGAARMINEAATNMKTATQTRAVAGAGAAHIE